MAGLTAVLAFAAKGLVPALADWTAVLIAAAAFGVLAGVLTARGREPHARRFRYATD